jgi:peptidylprolyl isomerase
MARRGNTQWQRYVVAGVLAAMVGGVGFAASSGGSSDSSSSTSTTTADSPASGSAKGKACVARVDPLPDGAPEVPVAVGPAPTKLVIEDLTPGTGAAATAASTVTVDYIGVACSTGKVFDASYSTGQPVSFGLNQVIPGWSQGLVGMQVGGTRLLGIPSDLAYGSQSPTPDIAPDEALWFVVQLKAVQG